MSTARYAGQAFSPVREPGGGRQASSPGAVGPGDEPRWCRHTPDLRRGSKRRLSATDREPCPTFLPPAVFVRRSRRVLSRSRVSRVDDVTLSGDEPEAGRDGDCRSRSTSACRRFDGARARTARSRLGSRPGYLDVIPRISVLSGFAVRELRPHPGRANADAMRIGRWGRFNDDHRGAAVIGVSPINSGVCGRRCARRARRKGSSSP